MISFFTMERLYFLGDAYRNRVFQRKKNNKKIAAV
jgi:hypothetical protein